MRLGSGLAVAGSSDLTPGLGTSICCGPKKQQTNKNKSVSELTQPQVLSGLSNHFWATSFFWSVGSLKLEIVVGGGGGGDKEKGKPREGERGVRGRGLLPI